MHMHMHMHCNVTNNVDVAGGGTLTLTLKYLGSLLSSGLAPAQALQRARVQPRRHHRRALWQRRASTALARVRAGTRVPGPAAARPRCRRWRAWRCGATLDRGY